MTTSGTKKPAEAPVVRPRPATADHLKKKRPATKVVEVVLDPALAVELRDAERRRDDAQRRLAVRPDDDDLQSAAWSAADAVEVLRARAGEEEAVVAVRFRSVGRVWDDLLRAHPPTADQVAEAKREGAGTLTFNPETFPAALVAAALDEPKLSPAEVQAIWESPDWNQAELGLLFTAALEVNNTRHTVDLANGSNGLRRPGG